jgi:hypothetical protein
MPVCLSLTEFGICRAAWRKLRGFFLFQTPRLKHRQLSLPQPVQKPVGLNYMGPT